MGSPPTRPGRVLIADLRPTQISVGFREVGEKRLRLRSKIENGQEMISAKLIAPVVLGPGGAPYLIDRHHYACAMRDEGMREVQVAVVADFSGMCPDSFWAALEARGWCRPYGADGMRCSFSDIPCSLDGLRDDPFRSLASALRRKGGFTKKAAPFSEFAWADFLRRRIPMEAVTEDFEATLDRALLLARTRAAASLPGWCAGSPPFSRSCRTPPCVRRASSWTLIRAS